MSAKKPEILWKQAPTLRQLIEEFQRHEFPMDARVVIDNDVTAIFDENYRSVISAQVITNSDGRTIITICGKNE